MCTSPFDELFLRYATPFRPLEQPEPLGGAGGYSGARLWKYRAEAGQFVLRAWPATGPPRAHLEQVQHWLAIASDLGFLPVPIPNRFGQALQAWHGRMWEIAPWLNGAPDCGRCPSSPRLRAAFTALAAFHLRLATLGHRGHSPGLLARQQSIRQLIAGGFDLLERACEQRRQSGHGPHDLAIRWNRLARRLAADVEARLGSAVSRELFLQPCLRDARPEHFLFEGERLTGLVDFGAMGMETVAADLARLIGEWLEGDRSARRDALDAYQTVRPLVSVETALIEVFEASASILIGERWSRWHYLEDRTFDDTEAVGRGIQKSISQMERVWS
jgi:Ser/Thr protein kinase RdoA (MazF antagonist)